MLIIHLPSGPTAYFRLSSVVLPQDIPGHGKTIGKAPELILNGLTTRLGHSVAAMLNGLFTKSPELKLRRVATFHNQREYLFFRHHRCVNSVKFHFCALCADCAKVHLRQPREGEAARTGT